MQGSHITQVEDQKGEETIILPSLFQNCPHQKKSLSFFNYYQSTNLSGTSCTIRYIDQPPTLGNHHSPDSICHDECPSTSCDLLFSQEDFNLDLECALVREEIHIETASSPQFPLCPTHSSSSLLWHEDNSSNQLSHPMSPIHLSLDVPLEDPLQLSNLIVVDIKKSSEICDKRLPSIEKF